MHYRMAAFMIVLHMGWMLGFAQSDDRKDALGDEQALEVLKNIYASRTVKGSILVLRPGSRLTYGVDFYGQTYDFVVTVRRIGGKEGVIEFDYEMVSPDRPMPKGTVTIQPEAVQSARGQFNYFQGGPVTLDDMTAVWVSRAVFEELDRNGEAEVEIDGAPVLLKTRRKEGGYALHNATNDSDLEDVKYLYAESDDGAAKYWIHYSRSNPFILRMEIGWKIWLKEFKY